ncbi:Multidrug resistance protein MdtH [Austwickia sp. TVS 96-490-7B]|uniref:MFS transporter n=1 Tax=Austwickia sp. TVS 96-490-7B TaxID=2830843 RepID=UPI001C56144A|nr:MFS transporter [Austwickia sp. TVS 96-490-7B]MBW3084987.1 Multidrug resistance protein MdtH [Austwickia sp. TVS 96-490-7B]
MSPPSRAEAAPPSPSPPPWRRGLRERLALPDVTGHRRFVVAMAVDAIGSGVFMPLAVLYFVRTTSVPLPDVGLAMSIAGVTAFPCVPLVGHLVDRIGSKPLLLLSNLIQAAAYTGFTMADTFVSITVVLTMTALGQATFWASYAPTVAAVSAPGEREIWFGFLSALRNVGLSVGGLVAGIAVWAGTTTAFHATVLVNAASYVVAFGLLWGLTTRTYLAHDDESHGGWGAILRDWDYMLLVLANFSYSLAGLALTLAIPVYVAEILRLPGWVVGALYVVNTVMVGFGQSAVIQAMTGHRRWRIYLLGQVFFTCGYIGMAVLGWLSTTVAIMGIFVAVAIYTLGELLGAPVLSAVAVESRPAALRGRYMSLYQLSWAVGAIVAPAAFTRLLGAGPLHVWWVLIAVSAVGAALAPLLAKRLPVAAGRVTNATSGGGSGPTSAA